MCMQPVLDPASEDATLTWGALSAQQLDADFQLLAWTGARQNSQLNDSAIPTVPQMFMQLVAGDNDTLRNGSDAWSPQVTHMGST